MIRSPFEISGPDLSLHVLGVRLVGFNIETGKKLLISLVLIIVLYTLRLGLRWVLRNAMGSRRDARSVFWSHQVASIIVTALLLLGLISVWFDNPARLATAVGLVTAGLAFALQRVITAVAGYFIILRGQVFNVGDRITMGGVRGDVIALGYTRTTIMEMGQPPAVQMASPAMWVEARQYTGRIVTISNGKIFDEPVYNYTREFPYIWEEMRLPVRYSAEQARAEQILLEAAAAHTIDIASLSAEALQELERRYFVRSAELRPRVYMRLTENWLELTVRFIAHTHAVRELKDAISRDVLKALNAAGIVVASATQEIVGVPPIVLRNDS